MDSRGGGNIDDKYEEWISIGSGSEIQGVLITWNSVII